MEKSNLKSTATLLTRYYAIQNHTVRKIEEDMSKIELITNLKGAYFRVDVRIEKFFLQTGCDAIYC